MSKRKFRSFIEPHAVPRVVPGSWPESIVDESQYEPLEATVARILRNGERLSIDAPQASGIYDEDQDVPIYRQRGIDAADVHASVVEAASITSKIEAHNSKVVNKKAKDAERARIRKEVEEELKKTNSGSSAQ